MFACLFRPPVADDAPARATDAGDSSPASAPLLTTVAQQFSPRYECWGLDAVVVDVSGLDRLFGDVHAIAEEMRRDAAARGARVHVAVAATPSAALVIAHGRPGVTVAEAGREAAALAPLPLAVLAQLPPDRPIARSQARSRKAHSDPGRPARQQRPSSRMVTGEDDRSHVLTTLARWGLATIGELAALPLADVSARLGRPGIRCHALACGDDGRPLVPDVPDERFESSIDLEWPIEGLEPLSFVLTRLLEPLSIRLERCDRGAAALHVQLGLVTRETHARRLRLPSPMRDVRTLRTLALLDLESHPPAASIDRVTIVIDPTPARVLQHTLFTRPHPAPEQLSTLIARLGALMGHDRIGTAVSVDSYRPGAFAMAPFKTEHPQLSALDPQPSALDPQPSIVSALRRCRHPVPARVVVGAQGRPVRVTTDRRGFAGGAVTDAAGPWTVSGEWWMDESESAGRRGFDRDEWDVALGDGGVYRIFRDRATDAWFIDAIVD